MTKNQKKSGGFGALFGVILGAVIVLALIAILAPKQESQDEAGELETEQDDADSPSLRSVITDALAQGREAYQNARREVMSKMK